MAVPSSVVPEDNSRSLNRINCNCLQSAVLCLVSLSRCFMTFVSDKEQQQQDKKESSEEKESHANERTTTMVLFADCVSRLCCGYAIVNDTQRYPYTRNGPFSSQSIVS